MAAEALGPADNIEYIPLQLRNYGADRTPEYAGSCRLFTQVAESFGVELTPQEVEDWSVLLGAAYIIDHIVDERQQDLTLFIDKTVRGESVPGVSDEATDACRAYLERQPDDRRQATLSGLYRLAEFPEAFANAMTVEELIRLRLEEADMYAAFLKLDIADGAADAQARLSFNNWVEIFSRSGYLVDSFFDLRKDYEQGLIGVPPSFSARRALAKVAIRELLPGVRATPLRALGATARVAIEHNRTQTSQVR